MDMDSFSPGVGGAAIFKAISRSDDDKSSLWCCVYLCAIFIPWLILADISYMTCTELNEEG